MASNELIILSDTEFSKVCTSLGNPIRLKILRYLNKKDQKTLKELFSNLSHSTGIQHRETFYKYVENLVEAKLIEKIVNNEGRISYKPLYTKITLVLKDE